MGEIKEGQKVKIFVFTDEETEKEFDCFIKEVYTDRLSLNFPDELLDYEEYLEEGEEIPVKIFTPLGIKSFNAAILDAPYEQDFTIEFVETTNDLQRREYVRVPLSVKTLVERTDKKSVITYTMDVSGGGIKFLSDEEFEPKEEVKLTMYMPDDRSIKAIGSIIENNHIPQGQHVLTFTDIEEKERDRIIKKCFEIQLSKE